MLSRRPQARGSSHIALLLTGVILVAWSVTTYTLLFAPDAKNNRSERALAPPAEARGGPQLHVVFSTSCSAYQHWQSETLFASARRVGHQGPVTRIASGCSGAEGQALTRRCEALWPGFRLHLTPDYGKDAHTGKSYKYFNKPGGLLHWLRHAQPPIPPRSTVVLIDPDFLFLRPFPADFAQRTDGWMQTFPGFQLQRPQRPLGQYYGLGGKWVHFNRTEICFRGLDNDCGRLDARSAEAFYAVGPPYVLSKEDMLTIAKDWVVTAPKVYREKPGILSEMYGYCMAAAMNNLRHEVVSHWMVSNPEMERENWRDIDALPAELVCQKGVSKTLHRTEHRLPVFYHYCQAAGRKEDWVFSKHRVPTDAFTCDKPLLAQPPPSIYGAEFGAHNNDVVEYTGSRRRRMGNAVHRTAFMLCYALDAVNEALRAFKAVGCEAGNFAETTRLATQGEMMLTKRYKAMNNLQ